MLLISVDEMILLFVSLGLKHERCQILILTGNNAPDSFQLSGDRKHPVQAFLNSRTAPKRSWDHSPLAWTSWSTLCAHKRTAHSAKWPSPLKDQIHFQNALGHYSKKALPIMRQLCKRPMNATNQTIDSDSFQIELLHSDNRIGIHLSIGAVIVRPFSRKFNFFFETQWCQPSPFEVSKFGQGKRNHSETDSCPWRFILPRSQRSYEALAISMVHPWRRWSCHSLLGNNTIISIIIFQKWPNKALPVKHLNHSWLW